MQGSAPPRHALPWDDVRLFLALCRSRTLSRAARVLGVDASTVSRRLVALEEALDASLFERGRDGVTPTKAAEDLLSIAEEIEAGMNRFATAADGLERDVSGLVRVTCPPDIAETSIAPLLADLFAEHPALRISLEPGESVLDLTRREADLALRTVRPTRGDLLVTKLTTVRWVLAASPKLERELGTVRVWSDVPWVGWGERMAKLAAARWLAKHAHDVEPLVRSDSLTFQLAVVSRGVGAALLPEPNLRHYGLAPLKLGAGLRAAAEEWPTDELYLVTHRALRHVPRVRAVWDLLLDRFSVERIARRR